MQRLYLIIILLFFFTTGFDGIATPNVDLPKSRSSIQTIVIDPGHGGKDMGCTGGHSEEKHLALAIAKKLGTLINSTFPDVRVVYTRETDVFVPLYERAAIANRNAGDVFISIHCNAVSKSYIKGTETYIMGLGKDGAISDVAKRENEVVTLEENFINNYGFDPNSDEGYIIFSLIQNAYEEQSIRLAAHMETEFKNTLGRTSRGIKKEPFIVLRMTEMPSILIESGFLTNIEDENFLRSENGQIQMAEAMLRAFSNYKYEIEGKDQKPISGIRFYKPERLEVIDEEPIYGTDVQKKVEFKIQLGITNQPVDKTIYPWKQVQHLETLEKNGTYIQMMGGYLNDYEACERALEYWKLNGFRAAFIVAFVDGLSVHINYAKALSEKK